MTKYLVTGALGFIGSNFVNFMSKQYSQDTFVILDKKDYCGYIENVHISDNIHIIIGDIANTELVNYILDHYSINIVVHFAAQTHVDKSFFNSVTFTINNVLGTHILLECCKAYYERTSLLTKFIHVSTDEVYGEVINNEIKHESSILDPTNPYAASKAAAEFMVKSYYYSYQLPIIITRGNNVYGIHQYPEKVIPKFIIQLLEGSKITIQGNGTNKRNFIHVDDVVNAFDIIIHKGHIGEIYNIGGGYNSEYTIEALASMLIKIHHNDDDFKKYLEYIEDRKFNDFRYFISNEKLCQLGWVQTRNDFTLELKSLFEWYKIHKSRYQ